MSTINLIEAYKILGLPPDAPIQEVKKTYRKLAKAKHPDKSKQAKFDFASYNKAYQLLSDLLQKHVTFEDQSKQPKQKPPPFERRIFIKLEDIATGVVKKVTESFETDSGAVIVRTFELKIEPGTLPGHKYTFEHVIPLSNRMMHADVVFEVFQVPHPLFTRRYNDLVYVAHITPQQAVLSSCTLSVPTLKNKLISCTIPGNVKEHRIEGKGLPHLNTKLPGDLIVVKKVSPIDKQDCHQSVDLLVSLEEVVHGCRKYKKITTKLEPNLARHSQEQFEVVCIDVLPGTKPNTVLKGFIHRKGMVKIWSNIKFVVRYKPHPFGYKCNGINVEYTKWISSKQAYEGLKYKIPSLRLNSKPLKIEISSKTKKDKEKKFSNEGLPRFDKPKKRGNFVVKTKIADEKDDTQIFPIRVMLENILHGYEHEFQLEDTFEQNHRAGVATTKIVLVKIEPGTENGRIIVRPNEGIEHVGKIPADIHFKVIYLRHKHFTPNGPNLEYTAEVTHEQLANNETILIPTLDDINLPVKLQDIKQNPIIYGFGLPFPNNAQKRGNIKVTLKFVKEKAKLPVHQLKVTLEQVFHGCVKSFEMKNGQVIQFNIKPGTHDGEEFVTKGARFVVCVQPHAKFTRSGDDIIHITKLSRDDLRNGIWIPTLDGNDLSLRRDPVPSESTFTVTYPRQGLPNYDNPAARGNLVVQIELLKNVTFSRKTYF